MSIDQMLTLLRMMLENAVKNFSRIFWKSKLAKIYLPIIAHTWNYISRFLEFRTVNDVYNAFSDAMLALVSTCVVVVRDVSEAFSKSLTVLYCLVCYPRSV